MDSCNSGSLQSSSGGDDEYDSRAAADSVFLGSNRPPSLPFLDPLPNYVHFQYQNPNTALPRPDPISSDPNTHPFPHDVINPMLSASPSSISPPPPKQNPTRNPKKRSRASRRAPTTVLTTDTTNFRAMVQEFTGIPSPLFNSVPFPRTRYLNSVVQPPPPPYLRRPFAQKIQSPLHFLGSSSSLFDCGGDAFAAAPFNLNRGSLLTSLLRTNPKFPFSSSPTKDQLIPSNDDHFDLGHGNHVSSSLLLPPDQPDSSNVVGRWTNNPTVPNEDKSNLWSESGGFDFALDGSSHREKAPENSTAAARGDSTLESWICSSE